MVKNSEIWGGLFWMAIGAFVTWQGRDLGLGRLEEPGSGFAFFWIGLLMVTLGGFVTVQAALTGGGASLTTMWASARWGRILAIVAMLLVLGYFFERIGFIVLLLALLFVCMFFIDPVRWWIAIPVALVAVLGSWGLLTEVLKIQLPSGVLEGAPDDWLRAQARTLLSLIGRR